MPHRSHIQVIEEYYTHFGNLVEGEYVWLSLEYHKITGNNPVDIPTMIKTVKG